MLGYIFFYFICNFYSVVLPYFPYPRNCYTSVRSKIKKESRQLIKQQKSHSKLKKFFFILSKENYMEGPNSRNKNNKGGESL